MLKVLAKTYNTWFNFLLRIRNEAFRHRKISAVLLAAMGMSVFTVEESPQWFNVTICSLYFLMAYGMASGSRFMRNRTRPSDIVDHALIVFDTGLGFRYLIIGIWAAFTGETGQVLESLVRVMLLMNMMVVVFVSGDDRDGFKKPAALQLPSWIKDYMGNQGRIPSPIRT